ncbi:NUDIX hydrolase [Aestuariimicrobium soli]|uniref:NUDIX hydrolase n=1 Tax=Aestuariimicrobium soli TaxID=2035834 RepID=UPI003EB7D861
MSWQTLTDRVIGDLEAWSTIDLAQEQLRTRYLSLLADEGERALVKGVLPAHLTSSVLVVDHERTKVLLTHHRRANRWLQFGGHLEEGDTDLVAAARREGSEEAGIALESPLVPVELDAHLLVGSFGVCQEHLDVRFVTTVPGEAVPAVSEESNDVAWFSLDRVADELGHLSRLVDRALEALAA